MKQNKQTIGILPLGRPTFDVEFANENLTLMLAALENSGHELVGARELLMDGGATEAAISAVKAAAPDQILILQVTFTDAVMAVKIGSEFEQPLSIWAVPEPRLGGRLRLNAFCGLNLASHALGRNNRVFSWLYSAPDAGDIQNQLTALIAGDRKTHRIDGHAVDVSPEVGKRLQGRLSGSRIGRIGAHPDGFDTCRYNKADMQALAGVDVDELELEQLFETAKTVPDDEGDQLKQSISGSVQGLSEVEPDELRRSLKLKSAIEQIRASGKYDAFAIRCWPETFTEYGGAVCGPVSMMGEARVPCACEADVYGAMTQLLLQDVADQPVFLVDLVDVDVKDGTGVVWHCGQAPESMADPDCAIEATIHTNRRMPLLYQFTLKPGKVTFVRISQAFGETKLVLASGTMVKRPMSFTGTSGVVEFDSGAAEVLDTVINSGLEHHMALAYGDHTADLKSFAAAAGIPVVQV